MQSLQWHEHQPNRQTDTTQPPQRPSEKSSHWQADKHTHVQAQPGALTSMLGPLLSADMSPAMLVTGGSTRSTPSRVESFCWFLARHSSLGVCLCVGGGAAGGKGEQGHVQWVGGEGNWVGVECAWFGCHCQPGGVQCSNALSCQAWLLSACVQL